MSAHRSPAQRVQCLFCTIGRSAVADTDAGVGVLPQAAVTTVDGTAVCTYHARPEHLVWTPDGRLHVHQTALYYAGYETAYEPYEPKRMDDGR